MLAQWEELGVELSIHGWIAYAIGAVGSVAVSGVLFYILFHSARNGYDDIDDGEDGVGG